MSGSSKQTQGISIGGGNDSDDEFGKIPSAADTEKQTCTVEIMPNQFGDDSESEEETKVAKDMGTDYDPPTRTEGIEDY